MKILIHGFYGMGNLGDEAILTALLREFDSYPKVKVAVVSMGAEQVKLDYGIQTFHSKKSPLKRFLGISSAKLFILGGGGIIKDYGNDPTSLENWLGPLALAKKLRKKTALCAVGVENIRYEKSKTKLRETLRGVDLITVRDENSKKLLRDIGVSGDIEVTADPAVLLGSQLAKSSEHLGTYPKVIISVRHWFDKGFYVEDPEANKIFTKSLAAACDYLIKRHSAKLEFVPFRTTSYDDDRIVAKDVVSMMEYGDEVNFHYHTPTPDEFIAMAGESALIIGMRLHSLILGAISGIPIIGLEYMPKVKAFMESIRQNEYSLNLYRITEEKLIGAIEKTFEKYDKRSKELVVEISVLRDKARKTIADIASLAGCAGK